MTQWPIDWRAVVDEAIRRRKQEGLSQRALAELAGVSPPTVNSFEQGDIRLRLERVIAILQALGLFITPSPPDSFDSFIHTARRRWEELIAPLPADHASRQRLGHCEQAYAIEGVEPAASAGELLQFLDGMPHMSGWPPFLISSRQERRPTTEDGLLECWLGNPDLDRPMNDTAHSDFWRVNRQGRAYLHKGFLEDGPDYLEPGAILDATLPIWRNAEVLIHSAALARKLGGGEHTRISYKARYSGLEGRELLSWLRPRLRIGHESPMRTRSAHVDLAGETTVGMIETGLKEILQPLLAPLYERFNGYRLPAEVVASELADMRRKGGWLP